MAKYIANVSGRKTEVSGTAVSAGVGNANEIVQLGADGKLDVSLMPSGLVDETDIFTAGENLAAGDFVYINSTDGKAYKADASNTARQADGYVLASIAAEATGRVYYEGANTGLTGLTVGTRYYLSATTAGGIVTTPTAYGSGGRISQYLGKAVSTTKLVFEAEDSIVLAA
jgi:hypothetical protein